MQRSSLGAGRSISRPSLRAGLQRPEIFTGCRAGLSSAADDPSVVRETLDGDLRCAHGATERPACILCMALLSGDPPSPQTSPWGSARRYVRRPCVPRENWVCFAIVRGGRYCSPRLLCRFDLAARALSIRRRIASEREGLSFCCFAQVSIADLTVSGRRTVSTGSRPVAGRPGFLGVTFSVDGLAMFW